MLTRKPPKVVIYFDLLIFYEFFILLTSISIEFLCGRIMYVFESILDFLQSCDKFKFPNWHILQHLLHKVDFCM